MCIYRSSADMQQLSDLTVGFAVVIVCTLVFNINEYSKSFILLPEIDSAPLVSIAVSSVSKVWMVPLMVSSLGKSRWRET